MPRGIWLKKIVKVYIITFTKAKSFQGVITRKTKCIWECSSKCLNSYPAVHNIYCFSYNLHRGIKNTTSLVKTFDELSVWKQYFTTQTQCCDSSLWLVAFLSFSLSFFEHIFWSNAICSNMIFFLSIFFGVKMISVSSSLFTFEVKIKDC